MFLHARSERRGGAAGGAECGGPCQHVDWLPGLVSPCLLTYYTAVMSVEILFPFGLCFYQGGGQCSVWWRPPKEEPSKEKPAAALDLAPSATPAPSATKDQGGPGQEHTFVSVGCPHVSSPVVLMVGQGQQGQRRLFTSLAVQVQQSRPMIYSTRLPSSPVKVGVDWSWSWTPQQKEGMCQPDDHKSGNRAGFPRNLCADSSGAPRVIYQQGTNLALSLSRFLPAAYPMSRSVTLALPPAHRWTNRHSPRRNAHGRG